MRRACILALTFVVSLGVGPRIGDLVRAGAPERGAVEQGANQQANDALVRQLAGRIAGRESEPAEQVFKNIQWLKGVRAGQLLQIMNQGYSRALGVACAHCHNEGDFASDEKRPKRAAREMAAMHRSINTQLAKMEQLATPATENRAITCNTCHRGAVNPRLDGR